VETADSDIVYIDVKKRVESEDEPGSDVGVEGWTCCIVGIRVGGRGRDGIAGRELGVGMV